MNLYQKLNITAHGRVPYVGPMGVLLVLYFLLYSYY